MNNKVSFRFLAKLTVLSSNINFWILTSVTLLLIFLYQYWPWNDMLYSQDNQLYSCISDWFHFLATIEFKYHAVGSLFIVPILYGGIVFWWRGALFAFILSLLGVLPVLLKLWILPENFFSNIIVFVTPMAIITVTALELQLRTNQKKAFLLREEERRLFLNRIIDAQESERQRIAHELHDDSLQMIIAIANRLDNLSHNDSDDLEKGLIWSKKALLQVADCLRNMSRDLKPSVIDKFGLIPALGMLVSDSNKETNIYTTLMVTGNEHQLSPKAEINIYRIVQEAFNNIKRHAMASKTSCNLEFKSNQLVIMVQDNGIGFDTERSRNVLEMRDHLGLIDMEERANISGGSLSIQSEPGHGTVLTIRIPYDTPETRYDG
jgi:signal transduction histidine kinase